MTTVVEMRAAKNSTTTNGNRVQTFKKRWQSIDHRSTQKMLAEFRAQINTENVGER